MTYEGEEVADGDTFTVVVNNYRYNGGGNYIAYLNAHGCSFTPNDPERIIYSTQYDMMQGEDMGQARNLLANYITLAGTIDPEISSDWSLQDLGTLQLAVLSTTDMHGRATLLDVATQTEDAASMERVATAVLQERVAFGDKVLLVDNGDTIQGTLVAQYAINLRPDEENPMITALDYIGYDAWVMGNHEFVGSNVKHGFEIDLMTDDIETNDGLLFNLDFDWAPLALNAALDGEADFYSIVFNAVGAKTLYQYSDEGGKHWFSISLVDRFNINWTSGDMVPVYAQKQGSLGRKVRGFASYSYNSEFTMVNNLDLRFTSPAVGIDGLYFRLNLFFDMGYGAGHFYNTDIPQSQFLASTGAQISLTIFDFIDIGYQVAYLMNGRNYAKGDTPFTHNFIFFLDF